MPLFEVYVSMNIGRSVIVEANDKASAEARIDKALQNHEITIDVSDIKDESGNLVLDEDCYYSGASKVNVQADDTAELKAD
jgi:hypothetical protein